MLGYGAILLLAGGYAYHTLQGQQGVAALFEKRETITRLQEETANLRQEVERRRERIRKLGDNRAEQELEIRRRLKYARPGESIIVLPPDKPADPIP